MKAAPATSQAYVNGSPWRGLILLGAVFFGAILFSAIVSPAVFHAIQWLAATTEIGLFDYLADHAFTRYFDRFRWLPVILLLPWLIRQCGLWGWQALGFRGPILRPLILAWLVGIALFLPIALAQFLFADAAWEGRTAGSFFGVAIGSLFAGLLLALLEETVFRGLILRIFSSALGTGIAVVGSALFFALVHFKKVPWEIWPPDSPVGPFSGFVIAGYTLASVVWTFDFFLFTNLLLAGIILNLLMLRTGSLWPCIGLHAGWVFFRQVWTHLAELDTGRLTLWTGTEKVIDGIAPIGILLAVIGALLLFQFRAVGPSTAGPARPGDPGTGV